MAGDTGARRYREGGSFEEQAGYSRAVRHGPLIAVSGTTGRPDLAGRGTAEQVRDCLTRAITAIEELGGTRNGIFRTRLFLAPGASWEEASATHRELLGDVAPANTTLFVHGLVGSGLMVEVEVDAWAGPAS